MKTLGLVRKYVAFFFAGIFIAVLCFIGINLAMAPTSKSEYCGTKCHEMKDAYRSWELSIHGTNKYGIRVECINCHIPKKEKFFTHITAKTYAGLKDIFKHHFGGEYDIEKTRMKVLEHIPSKRCLNCHNNLLGAPADSTAKMVHTTILSEPDNAEYKCVDCHENAGHERQNKLFSP